MTPEGAWRASPGMVWAWQDTIARAFHEAGGHVEVRHLVWGLLRGNNVAVQVLRNHGVDVEALREELWPAAEFPRPGFPGDPLGLHPADETLDVPEGVRLSTGVGAVLELAAEEATDHLGTAHVLLGLLRYEAPELSAVPVAAARAEIERLMAEFLSGRVPLMDPARADELISHGRARLSDELREAVTRVRNLWQEKEQAIDDGDYARAERVRAELTEALSVKAQHEKTWVRTVNVLSVVEEVETLRAEVDRLRAELENLRANIL